MSDQSATLKKTSVQPIVVCLTQAWMTFFSSFCYIKPGGGGTQVQKGAAPALRISRKKGSFLRPPHVRDFVKEEYFVVPRFEVWGSKSPYNPRNIRGSDAE